MIKLETLNQLDIGVRVKIITDQEKYNKTYSVKKLIKMWSDHGDSSLSGAGPKDTEILLDKKNNIYFSMNKFIRGTSWVKEAYILDGKDKRLKEPKGDA